MNIRLHQQARTTPAIRREIQSSSLSERALARLYNTTRSTLRKWKQRDAVDDASHRPPSLADHSGSGPGTHCCVPEDGPAVALG